MSIAIKAASVLVATAALCGVGAGVAAAATPTSGAVQPAPYVLTISPAAGHGPVRPMDLSDPRDEMIAIIPQPDGLFDVTINEQHSLDDATVVANESTRTFDVSISHQGTVLDQVELGAGARWHLIVHE
jgi:hypothetical protein